jgi:ATP-dependent Clp protease ATP-binding subunit ClpB
MLTSNLGSEYLASLPEGQAVDAVRGHVMEAVRAAFRPEFLNRLDEILLFRRLSRDDMVGIIDIQLAQLEKLLEDRKVALDIDAEAKKWLANAGYDPVYRARPLKRVIQRELQNPLAEKLLAGEIRDGDTVRRHGGPARAPAAAGPPRRRPRSPTPRSIITLSSEEGGSSDGESNPTIHGQRRGAREAQCRPARFFSPALLASLRRRRLNSRI